jgi:hypothetical protein
MKIIYKIFILLFLMPVCIRSQSLSQEVIGSSGDYNVGVNITLSSTLGEFETETVGTLNNILTQGFQQGSIAITSFNIIPSVEMQVNVFPNPATSFVTLQITNSEKHDFQYILYDIQGQEVMRKNFSSLEEKIDLQDLKPAIYLLKVFYNSEELNLFEIIKY